MFNPSIIDPHIDAAEPLHGGIPKSVNIFNYRCVCRNNQQSRVAGIRPICHCAANPLLRAATQRQSGARQIELAGNFQPNAAGGTGNGNDLTGKVKHSVPPSAKFEQCWQPSDDWRKIGNDKEADNHHNNKWHNRLDHLRCGNLRYLLR